MADYTAMKPPERGILPARFRVIDNVQDKTFILWDLGDAVFQKKTAPVVWATYTYWDGQSRETAGRRLRFITGMLNGTREPREVIEQE